MLTVRNYARKKLVLITVTRNGLRPPRITHTFIKQSAIQRRLALSVPTFHFLAQNICTRKIKTSFKIKTDPGAKKSQKSTKMARNIPKAGARAGAK